MGRKKKTEIIEESKKKIKEIEEKVVETLKEEIGEGKKKGKIDKDKTEEIEEKEIKKKITKEELIEKAKKLAEKISEIKTADIKEQLEKERKTLIPLEDYIKSGIYIGTKVITPHLRKYVYRRRNDGIAILDINIIDQKLKEFIKLVCQYKPEDFILICKREAGWKAVEKFSLLTGVRIFTKKYPAGILTNSNLPNFFETEMVLIIDPWIDKNAMHDAKRVKKKVLALCDTNNYAFNIDFFVPCNNKSAKSIGLVLYLLAKDYLKKLGIEKEVKISDFVEEDLQEQQG